MSKTIKANTQKKNVGTQTYDLDTILEIARLQEQVKLLSIENEHLRKYIVETPSTLLRPLTPVTSPNNIDEAPIQTESKQQNLQTPSMRKKSTKIIIRGCTCKGKCSSKQCGCVKKDAQCGESCKCDSTICQNQEHHKNMDQNKENLENIQLVHKQVETKETENKCLTNVTTKSIFSPDATHELTSNIKQFQATSLYIGSPKQLTFGSDNEEKEEEEEEEKEGGEGEEGEGEGEIKDKKDKKKSIKLNKNKENVAQRRSRSKKINLTLNSAKSVQKFKNSSDEEKQEQNNMKIEKQNKNYLQHIMHGMVSLRRSKKIVKQNLINEVKRKNTSDSDSKVESFEQKETDSQGMKNESYSINKDGDSDFDPMKPKHELARTPIRGTASHSDSSHFSDTSLPMPVIATQEEELQIPAELSQAEVDWEEYQSRLVTCDKCKRKFHPFRIKKHVSCCKKV